MSETAPRSPAQPVATPAEVAVLDSLVTVVEQVRRGRAALDALEVQALAGMAALADQQRERLPERRAVRDMPLREIAAEVALAVRASDRAVQGMITDAAQTVTLFPAAVIALAEGRIARGHLTALVDAGAAIDDPDARAGFEKAALLVAENESVGRFRAMARIMGERANPRSMAERHRAAREDRGVSVRDLPDGMAHLDVVVPAVIAYGIHDRITQQAKTLVDRARAAAKDAAAREREILAAGGRVDDPFETDLRTLGQVRADLIADMLLTAAPVADPTRTGAGEGLLGAIRGLIQVTVPVLTLAGVDDDVVELNGRVPIDPATARVLAGGAPGWDRVLTHPISGAVLAVDRHDPNADMKRFLGATDRRCRTFGCRMPAHRCDIDHNHDYARGGETDLCNLCHFCRRHHTLKHMPGWRVRQLSGGRIEWTTPTGRVYVDEPPPRAAYDPDPPPREPDPRDVPVADRGRAPATETRAKFRERLGLPTTPPAVAFAPTGENAPF